jgi:hypothetical protein
MDALRRSVEPSGSARAAPRPERPGIIAAGQAREDAPGELI